MTGFKRFVQNHQNSAYHISSTLPVITENRSGFFEGDAMLFYVMQTFIRIPFKFLSVKYIYLCRHRTPPPFEISNFTCSTNRKDKVRIIQRGKPGAVRPARGFRAYRHETLQCSPGSPWLARNLTTGVSISIRGISNLQPPI